MTNWNQLGDEIRSTGSAFDVVRRRHLATLKEVTNRNVIVYYSGWLQKEGVSPLAVGINDDDKNGFMVVTHDLDPGLGLDLVLHTPGGDMAATESLIHYLRSMFGTDIRAIVPQLAMSGGTMVACACAEILMGQQSSLGPIDPQIGGIPAHGVVEEFQRAKQEMATDTATIPFWQPIIAKYSPAFIGECEKVVDWSNEMTAEWLKTGMFLGVCDAETKTERILQELGDHALTKSHERHLDIERCREMGLNVTQLEDTPDIQDAVLLVHHSLMQTFAGTSAIKIIENHEGDASITAIGQQPP